MNENRAGRERENGHEPEAQPGLARAVRRPAQSVLSIQSAISGRAWMKERSTVPYRVYCVIFFGPSPLPWRASRVGPDDGQELQDDRAEMYGMMPTRRRTPSQRAAREDVDNPEERYPPRRPEKASIAAEVHARRRDVRPEPLHGEHEESEHDRLAAGVDR